MSLSPHTGPHHQEDYDESRPGNAPLPRRNPTPAWAVAKLRQIADRASIFRLMPIAADGITAALGDQRLLAAGADHQVSASGGAADPCNSPPRGWPPPPSNPPGLPCRMPTSSVGIALPIREAGGPSSGKRASTSAASASSTRTRQVLSRRRTAHLGRSSIVGPLADEALVEQDDGGHTEEEAHEAAREKVEHGEVRLEERKVRLVTAPMFGATLGAQHKPWPMVSRVMRLHAFSLKGADGITAAGGSARATPRTPFAHFPSLIETPIYFHITYGPQGVETMAAKTVRGWGPADGGGIADTSSPANDSLPTSGSPFPPPVCPGVPSRRRAQVGQAGGCATPAGAAASVSSSARAAAGASLLSAAASREVWPSSHAAAPPRPSAVTSERRTSVKSKGYTVATHQGPCRARACNK